jgi:hypothetical protein
LTFAEGTKTACYARTMALKHPCFTVSKPLSCPRWHVYPEVSLRSPVDRASASPGAGRVFPGLPSTSPLTQPNLGAVFGNPPPDPEAEEGGGKRPYYVSPGSAQEPGSFSTLCLFFLLWSCIDDHRSRGRRESREQEKGGPAWHRCN